MKRFLALLFVASSLFAAEGKWTPQQIPQIDPQWLRELGLELPPERLWDPARGTGLLAATIATPGCSGGWISSEGLFITNHHCLFGMLQEHATPENDIITNGFLARSREKELKSATARITVPRRFTDVTSAVLTAVPRGANDVQRYRAIEKRMTELTVACEKQPGARCRVAAHDGGVQYVLQEMLEVSDIRLVYAPPRGVGEYGGEIDNWMWPRHTGDFAIGRAYVDGKPYRPEFWFPISTQGVKPGDFVMVLGYPGGTFRSLTAAEVEERHLWFTRRAEVYRDWIELLEQTTSGSAAGEIAVADSLKTLQNRQKNALGQLDGFRRGNILAVRRAADEAVIAHARGRKTAESAAAVSAHEELAALAREKVATFDHDFLLAHVRMAAPTSLPIGPKALALAWAVARNSMELQLPDADRDPVFAERSRTRRFQQLEREQKSLFPAADRALFAAFVRRALALDAAHRIAAIDSLFAAASTPAAIDARIDELLARTKVLDAVERAKMLGETPEQLRARRDPLLDAAFALDRDIRALDEKLDRWGGAIYRLRPFWRRAVIEHAGRPVAPDGNSTLRVSFANVKGYSPRDAVVYQPQTTLQGIVEKHTGAEPFDVPEAILEAAREQRLGRWKDARLGDVAVGFLADADTTGGNSGSPTVNGRGELVGLNFDRVWENVANDFGYLPEVGRNVNVDIRYMLWLLEEVEKAEELLRELGIAPPAK